MQKPMPETTENQRCDHCDNGYDPGDAFCRFCGSYVGEPLGGIERVAEKLRWALCCGKDHCDAANHALDHCMSDEKFAQTMGCDGSEITAQARRAMSLFAAIHRRAEEAESRAARAELDCAEAARWAAQYERDHGTLRNTPPDFMIPF